jgi:transcriptional regulator with XRE-family HTH domain
MIRRKREGLGVSQEALAIKSGYNEKTIRNIEQGKRTRLQNLQNVCQAVGLPPDAYAVAENVISDPYMVNITYINMQITSGYITPSGED